MTKIIRAFVMGEFNKPRFLWFFQRLQSIFLAFAYIWVIFEGLGNAGGMGAAEFEEWLLMPHNAILLALTIVISYAHSKIGIEEIVLDYIHSPFMHRLTLILTNFLHRVLPILAVLSVIFVYLR